MSIRVETCYVLTCDEPGPRGTGCDAELFEVEELGAVHWPTAVDARAAAPEHRWAVPDAGPDLCPRCQCRRDGHRWDEWDDYGDHGFRFCDRCDTVQSAAPRGSGA